MSETLSGARQRKLRSQKLSRVGVAMSGPDPLDDAVLPAGVRSASSTTSIDCVSASWRRAARQRTPACYCCTASRSSPIPGAT
jgi:hypothetical protein